jgi:alpha-mannosidase
MEVASNVTKAEVNHPTTRPSPPVGSSWTDSMEGAIAVATHHDGMSGTERQQVANDYDQRISEGHFEAEAGVSLALSRLAGITESINHCNCQSAGDCLNISVCSFTAGTDEFTILAWNALGQSTSSWLRVPVTGAAFTVTDLTSGAVLPSQTIALDARTKSLPLLYVNKFGMSDDQFAAASRARANNATHTLTFSAPLPAAGYGSFLVKATASHPVDQEAASVSAPSDKVAVPSTVSNGIYELTLDHAAGTIKSIKNLRSGVSTSFNLTWGYYVSAEGHTTAGDRGQCTKLPNGNVSCSTVSSDHYTFRPAQQRTFAPAAAQPMLEVVSGALVTEIRQSFSSWATHVIRLTQGVPFVEVEWTAGPIPWDDGHRPLDPEAPADPEVASGTRGKELVLKFSSGLRSAGRWSADSNGREMIERVRDARGPAYPPLVISEPIAGNYYPVNSLMSLTDDADDVEMAVAIDTSVGGTSMVDGQLELMVHRRLQHAQRGGLNPLNETMCACNYIGMRQNPTATGQQKPGVCPNCPDGDSSLPPVHGCDCQGLTMRGVMGLVFDRVNDAHATRRQLVEVLNFAPTLAFTTAGKVKTPSMSLIAKALPVNIKLMTITNNYAGFNDGKLLLRLAHKYQVGEHSALSQPATFSLAEVFATAGFKVTAATETTLTANQPKESWEAKKKVWPTSALYANTNVKGAQTQRVALDAADESMTVTIRAMELKTYLVAVV